MWYTKVNVKKLKVKVKRKMKKFKIFRKNEIIDEENINEQHVQLEEKEKIFFLARNSFNIGLILVMGFLLVFGNFATIDEKIANIVEIIAFSLGILDVIGEIIYKKKTGYVLYNKIIILIAAGVFFITGGRIAAVVILMVYLICRLGIRFFKKRQNYVFEQLHSILPEKARVYVEGIATMLPSESIKVGNVIKVQAGETIPGDGTVFEGKATIDESILAESDNHTRTVKEDDKVWAGCKVLTGRLQVVMDVAFQESYMAQSIKTVEKVMEEKDTVSEKYVKLTKIYLAIMWILILATLAFGIFTENFQEWLVKGTCLMLATTLGSLRGLWHMAINCYILDSFENGVVFKEKKVVELLEKLDLVIIDYEIPTGFKEYKLSHIKDLESSKQEIMTYAGYLEYYSKHPVGRLIYDGFLQVAKLEGLEEGDAIHPELISDFNEFEGKGVSGYLGEMFLCVGNEKMMQLINLRDLPTEENKEIIYVAVNQKLLGYIALDIIYKDQDNKFYEQWGQVDIEKIALYNPKEDDFKKLLSDMEEEKEKNSVIGAVTRNAERIKEMAGGDFTILLDARCKNNVDGDLRIPGRNLIEISELKMDLAGAMSMTRLKCKGYAAVKIAFYGAAFFGLIPPWIPFVIEMLAVVLLSFSGDRKNASTDAKIR